MEMPRLWRKPNTVRSIDAGPEREEPAASGLRRHGDYPASVVVAATIGVQVLTN